MDDARAAAILQRAWKCSMAREVYYDKREARAECVLAEMEHSEKEELEEGVRRISEWWVAVVRNKRAEREQGQENVSSVQGTTVTPSIQASSGTKTKRLDSPRTHQRHLKEQQEAEGERRKEEKRKERIAARRLRELQVKRREERQHEEKQQDPKTEQEKDEAAEKLMRQLIEQKMLEEERYRLRKEDEKRRKKKKKLLEEKKKQEYLDLENLLVKERVQMEQNQEQKKHDARVRRLEAMQERQREKELAEVRRNQELHKVMKNKPLHILMEERAAQARAEEEESRINRLKEVRQAIKNGDSQSTGSSEKRYFVGKTHAAVTGEIKELRNARKTKLEEIDLRRRKMHNFSELVKVMYQPKQASPVRPVTETGFNKSPLPPLVPRAGSAEPPGPDRRAIGNNYMKAANEKALKHPKADAPPQEAATPLKPVKLERDKIGDKYLQDAKRYTKPLSQCNKAIDDVERARQLKELRKKANKLSAHLAVSPMKGKGMEEEQVVNQQYFEAVAAKMDLLLALGN